MIRFAIPILALAGAATAAILLGLLTHDALHVPRGTIRIDALTSATFIGVALVGSVLLERSK
jgi:hypothetical protein